MPKVTAHEFLQDMLPTARKVDRAVPAYNLTERLEGRMWETSKNIIDMKIELLERYILELKGMKKKLNSIKE